MGNKLKILFLFFCKIPRQSGGYVTRWGRRGVMEKRKEKRTLQVSFLVSDEADFVALLKQVIIEKLIHSM